MNFRSHEELFAAVRELASRLETQNHAEAAAEIRNGFACLNGLTDGWALFLESIDKVRANHAPQLSREDQQLLSAIRKDVHAAVHRR